MHNSSTGRHATFAYIGNDIWVFKVMDASGNIVATGKGTESDVEVRADSWVSGALCKS